MGGDPQERFFDASFVHRVPKDWGEEHWIVNKEYCGKKLLVRKDRRSSVHSHIEKDEVLYLDSGRVLFELDGVERLLEPGDSVHVPPGSSHRFTGLEDSVMTEFSTTHRDADVVRGEESGHVYAERFRRQHGIVDAMSGVRALVVGDPMLDSYAQGLVERISPEAPVPVVRLESARHSPGGAANVARSLAALGARVHMAGVTGDDGPGAMLADLLCADGIDVHCEKDAERPTTVKTRVSSATGQQIVRIDEETDAPLSQGVECALVEHVRAAAEHRDVVLVSDYAKGVCSPSLLRACIETARDRAIPAVVAPKPRSDAYAADLEGASLVVVNRREAETLTGSDPRSSGEAMAQRLFERLGAPAIVTLAADGMAVCADGVTHSLGAHASRALDVSGAGDTCVAVAAAALAAGAGVLDAADLANRAAAVAVSAHGTAAVSAEELRHAL